MEKELVAKLRNVSISRNGFLILEDIHLDLRAGEAYYLVGKTGSGKSSFLRLLYGEIPLQIGSLSILNQDLKKISPNKLQFLRRNFGLISQENQLFEDKNVFENLNFFLKSTSFLQKNEIEDQIDKIFEILEINPIRNKYIHELSKGQKQIVAIARAVIHSPKIILADEPTAHMDSETAFFIENILIKRAKKINACILIATHDNRFIKNFPGKVLKFEKKEIFFTL